MSIIEYIILSFALAIPLMAAVRGCALRMPVRLTRGLLLSALWGVEAALLLAVGMLAGDLLRFGLPEYDDLIYLGLMLAVALRFFVAAFRKPEKAHPAFDISRWSTALLLGVAAGTNVFFVGLALGFRVQVAHDLWCAVVPLLVVSLLLAYMGIMFGRRKKAMRERRWHLIAVLFLLVFAIKGAFY